MFHRAIAAILVSVRESGSTGVDKSEADARLIALKESAAAMFEVKFGNQPDLCAFAPGRVNLIGEHTDYNEGFVFPAAIDRRVVVAAARAPDASKVWSQAFEEPAIFDTALERQMDGWARFPSGAAWALARHGHKPSNINAVVVSDLPSSAGLSSSAAMELAFLTLWNEIGSPGLDGVTLAKLGQEVEHAFVGVQCGIMDQIASALGRAGQAMLIDTRTLGVTHVPLPRGVEIVVCDANKPRDLRVTAYNQRRNECEAAARALGVRSLRDATLELLDGTLDGLGPVLGKRARHVLAENERCVKLAGALADEDLVEVGRLMKASHESLRDDYEVSCPELDWMAEAAWSADGCIGARMTGAGFGGACVALVASDRLEGFLGDAGKGYRDRSNGLEPSFLVCRAAAGAGLA